MQDGSVFFTAVVYRTSPCYKRSTKSVVDDACTPMQFNKNFIHRQKKALYEMANTMCRRVGRQTSLGAL